MKFPYCYGDIEKDFSLSDYVGKIILLEMSASWWAPCYSSIPEGEEIYKYWESDSLVKIIHSLDDLNQPYSCSQWGESGLAEIPPMIGGHEIFKWFDNPIGLGNFPLLVYIDHEMVIQKIKTTNASFNQAKFDILSLLDEIPLDNLSISTMTDLNQLKNFKIRQLYPNPFNPSLTIELETFVSKSLDVNLFSSNGQLVSKLHSGNLMPGYHQLVWKADNQPNGVYFISVKSNGDDYNIVKKVVLIK